MPRGEYPDPFVPRTFSCWVTKKSTTERSKDPRTGEVRRRPVDCWDVEGRADGVVWAKRFRRAGLAQSWKDRLEADLAAGLPFDLRSKQFVVPEQPELPAAPAAPTVFELTERYFHHHPEWEPSTKESAARSFNRARRWLLVEGAEPTGDEADAVEDYLRNASFLPDRFAERITDRQRQGRAWLQANSASADGLTSAAVEEFVARFEVNERDPSRRLSAASITRFLQPLKSCWTWAVGRDDIPISRSPWMVVKPRKKVKGRSSMAAGRAALAIDADMVIDVPQALALAEACATEGSWGGIVECFVLVMALCGLRWGEAAGLRWDDVDLPPADDQPGWLSVRRSHRPTSDRWLDPEEDPNWGPLKDRDITDSRRVPAPPLLVAKLRQHRDAYGEGPGGLVFHRNDAPFDHDLFGRNVWIQGRAKVFPARSDLAADDPRQPKLSRLRRHDLRHAACSWWLREGVDAVVCQRWSGHRTLSVFLDVYQGVAPGREDEGVDQLVRSLKRMAVPQGPLASSLRDQLPPYPGEGT